MKNENLTAIFGRFAGKEVQMINKPWEYKGKTYDQYTPAENDPVVSEMKETAKDNGLTLRLWWPGIMGTTDYRLDRVNATIEETEGGKWKVANSFHLG